MRAIFPHNILWDKLRGGDKEALFHLYEDLYFDLVNYGIRVCTDVELTRDAINDIFLEIWDNRQKLNEVNNVKSYLFTYLRRKIVAGKEKTKRSQRAADRLSASIPDRELPYEEYIIEVQRSEEIKQHVRKAMVKLTARQRELVQLRFFDGLPYDEIEQRTGMARKTVYNTIHNALKVLSAELSDTLLLLLILRML